MRAHLVLQAPLPVAQVLVTISVTASVRDSISSAIARRKTARVAREVAVAEKGFLGGSCGEVAGLVSQSRQAFFDQPGEKARTSAEDRVVENET